MEIQFNGQKIIVDKDWSFKNFINQSVTIPEGTVVYSSNFYSETPDTVFNIKNVTFIKCNLDNLILPENNTIIECSQKRFEAQNDLNDWLIDENNDPVKPINFEIFEKFDLPIPDPADIPEEPVETPIDLIKEAQ